MDSKVDVVTAQQIKTAQQFEQADRKKEALVHVLKQACSRNKAIEKKALWEERHRQDHGSKSSISLKSNTGEVTNLAKIPQGAKVTVNSFNMHEEDRRAFASKKEDSQLNRFCDGQDSAWRPDNFFTEVCGDKEEVPPWPIRPSELFSNPHLTVRIVALQKEKRKLKKQAKKQKKLDGEVQEQGASEEDEESEQSEKKKKKDKKAKKAKKEKKEKKGKKEKKEKKEKGRKDAKKEKKEKKDKKQKKDKDRGKQKPQADQKERGTDKRKERGEQDAGEVQSQQASDSEGDFPALVLKSNEEVAKESRKRSREKEPSPSEQAEEVEEASSEGDSSQEEPEDERENSVQEVGSSSEADWERSDSDEDGR